MASIWQDRGKIFLIEEQIIKQEEAVTKAKGKYVSEVAKPKDLHHEKR
nr:hypothetical protein [uncultured Acetatifactor sp.]